MSTRVSAAASRTFQVGDRVTTGIGPTAKRGVIAYVGETSFSTGEWIGIILPSADGKNDGSVAGVRYFETEPNHGLFVKSAQCKLDKETSSGIAAVAGSATSAAAAVAPTTTEGQKETREKLAALREKRRLRESAGGGAIGETLDAPLVASTSSAAAANRRLSTGLVPTTDAPLPSSSSSSTTAPVKKPESVMPAPIQEEQYEEPSSRLVPVAIDTKEADAAAFKVTALEAELVVLRMESTKSREELEQFKMDLAADKLKQQEEYEKTLAERDTEIRKLKAANEAAKTHLAAAAEMQKESSSKAEESARIGDLENQLTEMLDTLEIMTLDKEQLHIDNELLEESIAKLKTDLHAANLVASSREGVDAQKLTEENDKLREALRRLAEQASHDAELANESKQAIDRTSAELLELRRFKDSTSKELFELRQDLEAATATDYESIIESLSEKNFGLNEKTRQLELTLSDLEASQELMEELDASQRQEIASLRSELDKILVSLREKERHTSTLEAKIIEGKAQQEQAVSTIASLRDDIASQTRNALISEEASKTENIKLREVSVLRIENERLHAEKSALEEALSNLERSSRTYAEISANNQKLVEAGAEARVKTLSEEVKRITLMLELKEEEKNTAIARCNELTLRGSSTSSLQQSGNAEEIRVLTEAISVLECRAEAAEREVKRSKTVSKNSTNTSTSSSSGPVLADVSASSALLYQQADFYRKEKAETACAD